MLWTQPWNSESQKSGAGILEVERLNWKNIYWNCRNTCTKYIDFTLMQVLIQSHKYVYIFMIFFTCTVLIFKYVDSSIWVYEHRWLLQFCRNWFVFRWDNRLSQPRFTVFVQFYSIIYYKTRSDRKFKHTINRILLNIL